MRPSPRRLAGRSRGESGTQTHLPVNSSHGSECCEGGKTGQRDRGKSEACWGLHLPGCAGRATRLSRDVMAKKVANYSDSCKNGILERRTCTRRCPEKGTSLILLEGQWPEISSQEQAGTQGSRWLRGLWKKPPEGDQQGVSRPALCKDLSGCWEESGLRGTERKRDSRQGPGW